MASRKLFIPDGYLTANQVAEFCGITGSTVRRYCRDGNFHGSKKNGVIWIIPSRCIPGYAKEQAKRPLSPNLTPQETKLAVSFVNFVRELRKALT